MRFTFNKPKTVQLVGKLITLSGGQINKMKLIKIMYLIDREALIKWGEPVTGDRMVSMPYGPVLSTTLDLLNFGDALMPDIFEGEPIWDRFISERNHTVSLKEPIAEDELSPAEVDLIVGVFRKFDPFNQFQLARWCHDNLPEWEDPKGSSKPIEFERVLEVAGKAPGEIEQLADDAEKYAKEALLFKKA
jgi:hypothetical protein